MRLTVYQTLPQNDSEKLQRANREMLSRDWQATVLKQGRVHERDGTKFMHVDIATPPNKGPHKGLDEFSFTQEDVIVRVKSVRCSKNEMALGL